MKTDMERWCDVIAKTKGGEKPEPQPYPHMCRDGHVQIAHSESEHEQCPLCRAMAALVKIKELPESDDVSGCMAEDMAGIAANALRSIA